MLAYQPFVKLCLILNMVTHCLQSFEIIGTEKNSTPTPNYFQPLVNTAIHLARIFPPMQPQMQLTTLCIKVRGLSAPRGPIPEHPVPASQPSQCITPHQ